MAKINVVDLKGKKIETMEISDSIFGVEVNKSLVHDAVKAQLANRRQGTHSTKTRGEVHGGGKKPFRQKGTGRARQGSTASPLMPHGGIAFGPKPRDYRMDFNRKAKKIAIKSALSDKVANEKAWAVDVNISEIRTRIMTEFFNNMEASEKYNLFVISGNDDREKIILSTRNIPKAKVLNVDSINVYDLVRYENLFLRRMR